MNPPVILGLGLVLSGGLLGGFNSVSAGQSPTSTEPPKETPWQSTLHTALTNGDVLPPFFSAGNEFYFVPADAAKILESRPSSELMPFFAELRTKSPLWATNILDAWTLIVREGFHGSPETITHRETNSDGIASTWETPVYRYVSHLWRQSPGGRRPYEPVVSAINHEDWPALRRLAKPGMSATNFIPGWEKYSPRVGKLLGVNTNATYPADGRPCILFEFKFENNKDGSLNPHSLQILVREENGDSTLLDFWNYGW